LILPYLTISPLLVIITLNKVRVSAEQRCPYTYNNQNNSSVPSVLASTALAMLEETDQLTLLHLGRVATDTLLLLGCCLTQLRDALLLQRFVWHVYALQRIIICGNFSAVRHRRELSHPWIHHPRIPWTIIPVKRPLCDHLSVAHRIRRLPHRRPLHHHRGFAFRHY
jgi:hypothetical protein